MSDFLLDTNHVSAALAPVSPVRERFYQANLRGERLVVCVPVLCELQAGIQGLSRPEPCLRQLRRLLGFVRIWPLEPELADHYGAIHHELRRSGRVMSQVDMILAAMARQSGATLLTTDRDFEALPDLRTANWTVRRG